MTSLVFEKKKMMGYPLGKDSIFPAMRDPIKSTISAKLDEDDNLFINYGMYSDSLPYTMQDDYDNTEKQELEFDSAVLENKHLKAVFVLSLGGRLWSLYDKDNQRDLLIDNPEFLPCNLAIRNAWFAGGVEYNIGRRGHDAQTCSPRFVAKLKDDDGTPVLRIYEMSRDRLTPFQLDFFLPEDSKFLYLRVRIMNKSNDVVPMYWWSNIATKEEGRIIVPTMESYANMYDGGSHSISKLSLPYGEGFDCTYPTNFDYVKDHFYNIPEETRKYECQFFNDGYGFAHASTRRLQGRKLFVWGMSQGGAIGNESLFLKEYQIILNFKAEFVKLNRNVYQCLLKQPGNGLKLMALLL